MRRSNRSAKGFTLIEVLVAGVILIISLSTMTLVYRGAVLSSGKATDNIDFSASIGLIFTTIEQEIRGKNVTSSAKGSGSLDGITYRWQSQLLESRGAADRLNPDSGDWEVQPERYYLWNVELIVEKKGKQRVYNFKEISWGK
jgi:type II secretory pathway pseudopilin PulG